MFGNDRGMTRIVSVLLKMTFRKMQRSMVFWKSINHRFNVGTKQLAKCF